MCDVFHLSHSRRQKSISDESKTEQEIMKPLIRLLEENLWNSGRTLQESKLLCALQNSTGQNKVETYQTKKKFSMKEKARIKNQREIAS